MSCPLPQFVENGWRNAGDPRSVVSCREVSAAVSTNRVYELTLDDGHQRIAKTSSYGNYPQFVQDHQLISEWIRRMGGTRYRDFLAPIVERAGVPICYREGNVWMVLYEKVPFYDFLPARLSEAQVDAFGLELARFHKASSKASKTLTPSWKTIGSDLGCLHAIAGSDRWLTERTFEPSVGRAIRQHCETLLTNANCLGYHLMEKIPLLIDWNTGNFSVGLEQVGFRLHTRWDYDWFRVEPRILDFYFCARVVRDAGDETEFSYLADPFFEPRFTRFLTAYHAHSPLSESELLFLKEAYRFFILNYVLFSGEHFFRPRLRNRLQKEAVETYLPQLEQYDFRVLVDAVLG